MVSLEKFLGPAIPLRRYLVSILSLPPPHELKFHTLYETPEKSNYYNRPKHNALILCLCFLPLCT